MACTESLDWRKVKIGWIGVGNIGEPICRNLLKSGLALTICDIAQERLDKFAKDSVWVAKKKKYG